MHGRGQSMECSNGMKTRFHESGNALLVLVIKWGDQAGSILRRFQHVDEKPAASYVGRSGKILRPNNAIVAVIGR